MGTKGVIMFGVNNTSIDYIKLAIANAKLITRLMGVPVTLITDKEGSTSASIAESGVFDQVVIDDNKGPHNSRHYRDTAYHVVNDDFKNFSRPSAYDLSPYDETLLIDVDYIIQDSSLNACWGSVEDLMINKTALSLLHTPLLGDEFRLNTFGIRMYWATVVYFKKTDNVRTLFGMVNHIKEHWEFYKLIYNFPNTMYRNDYAFAIAIHTMNGFVESTEVKPLPVPYILTATDKDQLYKVLPDGMLMFVNDPVHDYKFSITKVSRANLHCMNKISLLRNLDALGSMYE